MDEILKFILQQLKGAGLNYHFERYETAAPVYPYHIGSLLPTTPTTEDGLQEYTFEVDSFSRGSLAELLKEVEKIENIFPRVEGKQQLINSQLISVYYLTAQPIDTGEEDLKRIQTQLAVKTWKGR